MPKEEVCLEWGVNWRTAGSLHDSSVGIRRIFWRDHVSSSRSLSDSMVLYRWLIVQGCNSLWLQNNGRVVVNSMARNPTQLGAVLQIMGCTQWVYFTPVILLQSHWSILAWQRCTWTCLLCTKLCQYHVSRFYASVHPIDWAGGIMFLGCPSVCACVLYVHVSVNARLEAFSLLSISSSQYFVSLP